LSSTETGGSQSDFTLDLKATVVLRVLDRRGEECLASLAYLDSEASMTAGGRAADEATIASLEQEVARLVHLRIATDGTLTAWSFPADMPGSVKELERGLLDEMRFVVPSDAGAAWSTKESDASGLYSVEYARTREDGHNVDVGRRRATFTSQDESRTVTLEARIEDESQASFDLSLGWFSQATCNEQTTVDVADAGVVVETRNIATWRLIESQHAPGSEELADWELPWVDDLGAVDRRQDDEERQRKRDEAAIAGLTLENVLYDIEEVLRTGGLHSRALFEASQRLKSFLRQRPGDFPRFAAYVSDGSLVDDAVGVALSVLGSVGTPAGQRFLAEVAADPVRDEKVRMLSMFALFQVAAPDADADSVITAQWLDPEASIDLRGTALLLLGTHARGSSERCGALLAYEPRAEADGMLDRYVSALGNAHLYTNVEPYLQHPDPLVRLRAQEALQRR